MHWAVWQSSWDGLLKRWAGGHVGGWVGADGWYDLPHRCSRDTLSFWSSTTRHFYSNNLEFNYRWSPFCLLLSLQNNYCRRLLSVAEQDELGGDFG